MIALNLRLPEELHTKLKEMSQHERRSLNNQIIFMLEEQIRQIEEAEKSQDKQA